jgi:hydroxymethylpyrimidine/phosphomethylpyrimidine kinase
MKPRVLLVGGVDPSGGAGLSVDAAVTVACGAAPLPVPIALTVQSRRGFRELMPVPESSWRGAIEAQFADAPVHAVKVGLVGDVGNVLALAATLRRLAAGVPIIVDPVLGATAGGLRGSDELLAAYRSQLVPLATLLTPNAPELAALFNGDVDVALASGAGAVLHKGGHREGAQSVDELHDAVGMRAFARERLAIGPVRGTGCALASAIAALLARGFGLDEAVRHAGDRLAAVLASLGPPASDGLPRLLPLARWPIADVD